MPHSSIADRHLIRAHVRHLRRSLTLHQQHQAANVVAERVQNFRPVRQAQHIALFLSTDGELDTRPLIKRLWQLKKNIYLPVLHPFSHGQLLFIRYDADTPLQNNRLHIAEPALNITHLVPLSQLEVVIMPVVAFDTHGQRLGMGGGYYDRTLQNWQRHRFLLTALAHDCQQMDKLPVAAWDVPLSAIFTPSALWQWDRHQTAPHSRCPTLSQTAAGKDNAAC